MLGRDRMERKNLGLVCQSFLFFHEVITARSLSRPESALPLTNGADFRPAVKKTYCRSCPLPDNAAVLEGGRRLDGARLSQFPQLTWLRFSVTGDPTGRPVTVNLNGACHVLSLTTAGHHSVRWITRGRERHWCEGVGTSHFLPADDEHHTFLTKRSTDFISRVLLLPREHFHDCLATEGCDPPSDTRRLLMHDDVTLQDCFSRLFAHDATEKAAHGGPSEESARRLILRITELAGGGKPDWHDDESVFEARELRYVVGFIDEHLQLAPTLNDVGLLVGLSPSHFAKKFRQSTGLSFHRFVNRRRILASLVTLKEQSRLIAHVAHDLGFSSQSHFTHVFSDLTGMTPAKYQKQFRRTVGVAWASNHPLSAPNASDLLPYGPSTGPPLSRGDRRSRRGHLRGNLPS